MADRSFEGMLEQAFGETPAAPDADLFAARVERALGRRWAFRKVMIGALGGLGGVIGGLQFLKAGIPGRLESAAGAWRLLGGELGRLPAAQDLAEVFRSGAALDIEVLWMSGALALIALGLFVTRSIRDF